MTKHTYQVLFITLLLICSLWMLSACSHGNELRVTEYDGEGGYPFIGGGVVGGCRVIQEGEINACVEYQGKSCRVTTCP